MKKLLLLLALLLAAASPSLAYDFMVDGLCYNKNSDGTSVTVTCEEWVELSKTSWKSAYWSLSGEIVIPASVTYKEVTYTVTSIGIRAFLACRDLTSVTIPNSVTSIGERAFQECSGLTSVNITDLAAWCNISFDDFSNPLSIAHNLYLNGELVTDLVIPNSVTKIKEYAFSGCSGLTSVTIPNSVTSIDSDAFYNCSGLTSVNISDLAAWCKILFRDYASNPLCWANSLFLNGNEIKDLVIPNSVTTISNYAFSGCSGLTSVTTNSVTSIGNSAFSGCSGLASVTIGNSVTSIGKSSFSGCTGLTRVTWNVANYADFTSSSTSPFEGLNIASIEFGDKVERIPARICYNLTKLTSVTIPNSVTYVGDEAFYNTAWYNNKPDGLVYAGLVAYRYKGVMPSGTCITIKEETKTIGYRCFYYCTGLTSVTIPGTVTSIGSEAFSGCDNLLYAKFEGDELPSGAYNFPDEAALFVKTLELAKESSRLSYKVAFKRSEDSSEDGTSFSVPVHMLHESGEYVDLTSVKCDGNEYNADGASSITLTHLFPSTEYPITLKWTRNGKEEQAENQIRTGSKIPTMSLLTSKATPTTFVYEIMWGDDMDYLGEPYMLFRKENVGRKGTLIGLVADQTYGFDMRVVYSDDSRTSYYDGGSGWFTTPKVSFSEQKANMIKDTKVMLVTATNLADVETNCGFEWRRYDAPDEMPSTQVPCPVFGGNMAGILEGLSKDVYYKFRPYVKYSNGDASYGEWVAFITADAGVKFSPMVYTYDDARSDDAGVILSGVVIEGSDPVAEQGFEYWENYGAPATAKAERGDHLRIAASGERMSATISNNELVNGATYSYRSYAIVGGEEFYGDIKTFVADHGGIDGVEGISIDSRNADDPDALIDVYNINGQTVRTAVKRSEAVKGLLPGFYIVGGRKVLVK